MKIKTGNIIKPIIMICIFYTLTRAFCASLFGALANVVFLGFMGILMLGYFMTYNKQSLHIERTRFFYGMVLYLILVFISLVTGRNSSTYALFEYVYYALFIYAVCFVLRFLDITSILSIYEGIGVILSVEAIWEFFTGNILYRNYSEYQLIRRAYGLIGSPLTLGMVLACISIMSFYRGRHEGKVHFIITALSVAGMLCTQSRGPFVGLIAGFIVMIYLEERIKSRELAVAFLITLLKVTAVAVGLFIVISILARYNATAELLIDRIRSILVWRESGTSNYTRTQRWQEAIWIFKEYPILGYGVSSTGPHASTGIITESGLLKKLVETGIAGFILYYYVYVRESFRGLFLAERKKKLYVSMAFGIIVAIFVENIIMQIVESAAVYLIFSFCFGYIFIISRSEPDKALRAQA